MPADIDARHRTSLRWHDMAAGPNDMPAGKLQTKRADTDMTPESWTKKLSGFYYATKEEQTHMRRSTEVHEDA